MEEMIQKPSETNIKKNKPKSKMGLIAFLLIVVLAAGLLWTYYKYNQAQKTIAYLSTTKAQQEIAQKEIDVTLQKMAKHMIMPEGEKPTVARIEDAATLSKQQAFFKGASNGDQLLIFASSSKAIIYNPVKDIIVNVGPIFTEPQNQQTTGQQTTPTTEKTKQSATSQPSQNQINTSTETLVQPSSSNLPSQIPEVKQ
jgi:hypothetical protein